MARKVVEGRRLLTEKEVEHVRRLLWGRSQAIVATHVGINAGMLQHAIGENPTTLPEEAISRLMSATSADIQKSTPHKPKRVNRVFIAPTDRTRPTPWEG